MLSMKSATQKMFGSLLAFFVLYAVSAASTAFAADAYPSKTVRIIDPWPAGASTDSVGRQIASKLSERLGKQVIVENRGGAGGIIGAEAVAKADPDGHTLLIVQDAHTLHPFQDQKLSYDLIKSFTPIAKMGIGTYTLVVHPSVPANSLKEFIALAKQKPGQLTFAGHGTNGMVHLYAQLFKIMANIDFKIVQFKGGGPAIVDVLGGHNQMTMGTVLAVQSHVKSGMLRALAICGPERSVLLPDVPTSAEAGLPGYRAGIWWGLVAPAGTPAPIADRLNNELRAVLASDEVKKWFLAQGSQVDYLGPAEFRSFLEAQMAQCAEVVKKANIKWEE
jgi:tripartite-type tricarboxylate transporter receptor subunit TctC